MCVASLLPPTSNLVLISTQLPNVYVGGRNEGGAGGAGGGRPA